LHQSEDQKMQEFDPSPTLAMIYPTALCAILWPMHLTVLPRFSPIILLAVGAAHPQNAAMSKLCGLPNRPKNHATLLLITQSDTLAPGQPTQTNTPPHLPML
jgi:hypothetical protein